MILFLVIILWSFIVPTSVSAQVIVTEIMYDLEGTDTGREWIEIQNIGTADIDISDWKLFEANTNHRLTAEGLSVISAGGFALIADNVAKFRADWPTFSGTIFDSSFSLSNEGETLILRDGAGTDIDTVSYSSSIGANGDGKSLIRSSSGWSSGTPSPGTGSSSGSSGSSSGGVNNTTNESETNSSTKSVKGSYSSQSAVHEGGDEIILEVSSGRDRLGFVGTPISFEAKVRKPKDLASVSVAHRWSMGDGTQKTGQFVSHTYIYPGDYVVILNSEYGGEKAVSRVRVRIISPQVRITETRREFVEITNAGNEELNIGGWAIEGRASRFVIPDDTIILPNGSVRLSGVITRIDVTNGVRLVNQSSMVLAEAGRGAIIHTIATNADGELMVEGVPSAEEIRTRYEFALREEREMRAMLARSSDSSSAKISARPPQSPVAPSDIAVSATSQPAAVIYTVGGERSRGVFKRIWQWFVD